MVVLAPSLSNAPPSILVDIPYLPPDITYAMPNTTAAINLTLQDLDSAMGLDLEATPLQPSWITIESPELTSARTAGVTINLNPSEDHMGPHLLCLEAVDMRQARSLPLCLVVVVVTPGFVEVCMHVEICSCAVIYLQIAAAS